MRNIDSTIIDYFKTRKPFTFAHLIKFERPILSSQELDTTEREFVYLTDASVDLYFNDPRVDNSAENLAVKYRSNRVLDVPSIKEYSKIRATSLDLKLDANAIGAYLADIVNVTGSGDTWEIEFTTISAYDKGISEGDKVIFDDGVELVEVEVLKFPSDNVMRVSGTLTAGSKTAYITLNSAELTSILQDKNSPNYASFINREVHLYKVFFDENNNRIGTPYYLYKGIIQDVSLEDNETDLTVSWTLNSHWGDFSEVRGRMTTDESHRALNERGVPQPNSAIKRVYAYDKGFMHADTAVHVEANYTVQVEKQDVKYKKGFFGIGAKVKVKKYFVDEARSTELDFQLQGKTLDVIYGVRPAEGSPIFADTENTDSSKVYVAYAICEGEIGGIYDLIIQDKSLICTNEADADARATQTEENNVAVVCYGRADRGDVLEGVQSTTDTAIPFYTPEFYLNSQNMPMELDYAGFNQPLTTNVGSVGLLHENSIKLEEPIDMTISVYTGRSNQRAAPNLVDLAVNNNFKIQNDYWQGDDTVEYWGPNHRLLDTAYALIDYKISEEETTIPAIKSVVKGKFIPCFNYDNSYQHNDKVTGESATNFKLGDTVDIYDSNDTLLDSGLRILKKFLVIDRNGILQTRFELDSKPSLGYVDGVPSVTQFYMKSGANKWSMLTYNHVEQSGSVAETIEAPITGIAPDVDNRAVMDVAPASPVATIGQGMTGANGRTYKTNLMVY